MKKNRLFKLLSHASRVQEIVSCMLSTPQWMPLTLAYLNIKPLRFPFEFATRRNEKIILNTFHDLVTVWVIFFRREYLVSQDCKVILDAGANIGSFSIFASRSDANKIYAIEPFPQTFEHLKKNISLNNLEQKVQLFQMALCGQPGVRKMDLSPGPSQSRGLLSATSSEGLDVPAQTIEGFLNSNGLDKVDLLKMDIEGGEYEVFKGCEASTLNRIDEIVMEYHPTGSREELFQHLQKNGFSLVREIKFGGGKSGVAHFVKEVA